MIENKELELALNFIEKTDRNLFITGKAGTGNPPDKYVFAATSGKQYFCSKVACQKQKRKARGW